MLNLFAGVGVDGTHSGIAAGGAVGWELTPRVSVEGSAAWFGRGRSAGAFSADFTTHVNVVSPRPIVPFVKAGVGVHHAWFDSVESPIPGFYRDRIVPRPIGTTVTFTDPAVVIGGGFRVWLSDNLALRPEVDARLVVRGSGTHWLTTAALRLAYYFEDRPISDRNPRPLSEPGSAVGP